MQVIVAITIAVKYNVVQIDYNKPLVYIHGHVYKYIMQRLKKSFIFGLSP